MKLIEFTISHYCEKARWGLDHHAIPYTIETVLPGPHLVRVKRLGVPKSSVPILLTPDGPLQGSRAILDWADVHGDAARPLTPTEPEERDRALEWEQRLDRDGGNVLRRVLYDSLLRTPHLVVDMWTQAGPPWGRAFYRVFMPVMARALRRNYRINPAEVATSTERFRVLADDLDSAFARGPYLVGDRFTRADLTAAALLAPLCMPPEHHIRWPAPSQLPEDARRLRAEFEDRPFFQRVLELYRTERRSA